MARRREEQEQSTPFQVIKDSIILVGTIVLTVAAYKAFPDSVGFAKLLLGLAIPLMTFWSAFCIIALIPFAISLFGGGALVSGIFLVKSIFSLLRRRDKSEGIQVETAQSQSSEQPRSSEGRKPIVFPQPQPTAEVERGSHKREAR